MRVPPLSEPNFAVNDTVNNSTLATRIMQSDKTVAPERDPPHFVFFVVKTAVSHTATATRSPTCVVL